MTSSLIRDFKAIATRRPLLRRPEVTSPKMTQCAFMLEMTFRPSAKSYHVKTRFVALSLRREYITLNRSRPDYLPQEMQALNRLNGWLCGQVVSREGISTYPEKVRVIKEWPVPFDES